MGYLTLTLEHSEELEEQLLISSEVKARDPGLRR